MKASLLDYFDTAVMCVSHFLVLTSVIQNVGISFNVAFCRDSLYEELKDDLITLMKSRYAVFFVLKLVKHGNKEQKAKVFKVFVGKPVILINISHISTLNLSVNLSFRQTTKNISLRGK